MNNRQTNEDWLRTQLLKVAPEENKRMREVCGIIPSKDPWSTLQAAKKSGARGGRPQIQRPYRDYFLNRTEDAK